MSTKKFIFVCVALLITLIALTQAQEDVVEVHRRRVPTIRPTIRPTSRPICIAQAKCTPKSAQVCARNRHGLCGTFKNICQLDRTNCGIRNRLNAWKRVPLMQCEGIPLGKTAKCRFALICISVANP